MKGVAVALLMAVAGCGSAKSAATTTTDVVQDSVYTPMPTTPPPSSTTPAATQITVPIALIEDCVHFVELGAFLHVPEQQGAWDMAGHNEATQRVLCEVYGQKDPAGIAAMSVHLHELQIYMAGVTTTTKP